MKPKVSVPKYFKRIFSLMADKSAAKAFKSIMVDAIHAEKLHKESARRTKEKGASE